MSNELIEELGTYAYDPVTFVYWAFPWGEPGELIEEEGPDEWQLWVLTNLRDGIINVDQAIQIAVTSGHGIGKSALVAWIVLWAFCTFPGTRGVVTANTENQLKTKTWVEIAKWHRLFIARQLFKFTATALFSVDEEQAREWRIDIVPWSEKNVEAFAGLHNAGKRLLIIFDEASAIHDLIWETTEGALTDKDTEIIWCVFGNPTKNTGRFRHCFPGGDFEHRWTTREVDSRTVKRTNKQQLDNWIKDYGEDSDFARVRILGRFPRADANTFISYAIAKEAVDRVVIEQNVPFVLGVDVARFGDDKTVIYPRKGRDAFSEPPRVYQGLNTMQTVTRVMEVYYELQAAVIFVDTGGIGAGVFDRLAELGLPVIEVNFAFKPDGSNTVNPGVSYANKRAEMWGAMRDFLNTGSIPDKIHQTDISLVKELTTPTYNLNAKSQILLESKDLMKRRGEASPDVADALALTFAYPVNYQELQTQKFETPANENYNPYAKEFLYDQSFT